MGKTKIEWCDHTINPIVGCSKCSPGCDNCYAERGAARMAKNPNVKISGKYAPVVDTSGKWNGKTAIAFDGYESSDRLHDWMLAELPNKPSRIFVGSMGDIFHESVEQEWLEAIWEVMRISPQHIFMLLSKREKQLYEWAHVLQPRPNPLPNVWLGVTVCNQKEAAEKIYWLLRAPAARRFVSVEPMLSFVNFTHLDVTRWLESSAVKDAMTGATFFAGDCGHSSRIVMGNKLDWVICGGETGAGARPMHPHWVHNLRKQCQETNTPFFFKGWGQWLPCSQEYYGVVLPLDDRQWGMIDQFGNFDAGTEHSWECVNGAHSEQTFRIGKKRAGRLLDDVEYSEFPSTFEEYLNRNLSAVAASVGISVEELTKDYQRGQE